ncbi:hypothetical protein I4U23_003617 [Adineta vaga]|nr:hypothetical protein I4U23_003617 [Adineta vaga]
MFMAAIIVFTFFIVNIFGVISNEVKHLNGFPRPEGPCANGNCQPSKNFLIPLIISIVALFLVILLAGILLWYCLRRRNRNKKEISKDTNTEFADLPPAYYNNLETNE